MLFGTETFLGPVLRKEHAQLHGQAPVVGSHYHALIDLASRAAVLQGQPPISVVPLDRHPLPPLASLRDGGPLKPVTEQHNQYSQSLLTPLLIQINSSTPMPDPVKIQTKIPLLLGTGIAM
jgi:hypothetical protein